MKTASEHSTAHRSGSPLHRARTARLALCCVAALALVMSGTGCDKRSDETGDGQTASRADAAKPSNQGDTESDAIPTFDGEVPRALRVQGVAGYDEPSMAAFGDACIAGQVPRQPQHTFRVASTTDISFLVRGGDDDLSLVITGPGGPYCNDDYDGLDPGFRLELEPGEYAVYVGTYGDQPIDPTPDYTLNIRKPGTEEPRNPVLNLLDARLSELIETAQPAQREQFQRIQVMLQSLDHPRGRSLKAESVDELRELLGGMHLSESERGDIDALIERLSDDVRKDKDAAPRDADVDQP